MTPKRTPKNTVSLTAAAREVALDARTLEKRLVEAKSYPDASGRYRWGAVVHALAGDGNTERLRRLKADAELAELQVGKVRGTVLDGKAVVEVWTSAVIGCRTRLLQIPDRLRPRFSTWANAAEFQAALDGELRDALTELSTKPDYLTATNKSEK